MWYAVVDRKTSELFSVGTVLAEPMPARFRVVELGEGFAPDAKVWDRAAGRFIEDPVVKAVVDEFLALPGVAGLAVGEREALGAKVRGLLGV